MEEMLIIHKYVWVQGRDTSETWVIVFKMNNNDRYDASASETNTHYEWTHVSIHPG